jgi:hypothetical protein
MKPSIAWFALAALLLVSVTAGSLIPVSAGAGPLPVPSTNASCASGAQVVTDPIACSFGGATASVLLTPVATVMAEATNAGAGSALEYYFEVVGGSVGDVVPVLVTTFLDTSAIGSVVAQAGIVISVGSNFQQVTACTGGFSCFRPPTFEGDLEVSARVGTVYRVNLNASVALFSITGSGFAIADPYIHVDPSFAQAADYRIEVSPGVANAIPEPGTSALLGGAMTGLAWRRRRVGPRSRRR